MYDDSIYEHNRRMMKILDRSNEIRKLEEQYYCCERQVCYNNMYNDIECNECKIYKHNKKIKEKINKLKEVKV